MQTNLESSDNAPENWKTRNTIMVIGPLGIDRDLSTVLDCYIIVAMYERVIVYQKVPDSRSDKLVEHI